MNPGAKRPRLDAAASNRLKSCIGTSGASDLAVHSIWNKAVEPEKQVPLTTFKRYVEHELVTPLACFDKCGLKAADGSTVDVYVANIQELVHYIGTEMASLASLLQKPLSQGVMLEPLMYHDEAIASNPLATEKCMKSVLVYLSWKQLERSLFHEDVWLPVACVQHSDTDKLASGFNAVMSLLLDELFAERWQVGFATTLILVLDSCFCIVLKCYRHKGSSHFSLIICPRCLVLSKEQSSDVVSTPK